MEKKFKRTTVTSALPYANGPVHIGHLAGVYVPADIYVRYLRLKKEDVLFIGGSDEPVIGCPHQVPEMADNTGSLIHKFFGGQAFFNGTCFNLLAVLIASGLEMHIISVSFLISGYRIRQHDLIAVTDVRFAGSISYRSSYIIRSFVVHNMYPLISVLI